MQLWGHFVYIGIEAPLLLDHTGVIGTNVATCNIPDRLIMRHLRLSANWNCMQLLSGHHKIEIENIKLLVITWLSVPCPQGGINIP